MEKLSDKLGRPHLQLVVPTPYKAAVLKLAHRPGHLGSAKTLSLLIENFFRPSVRKDVTIVSNSCEISRVRDGSHVVREYLVW